MPQGRVSNTPRAGGSRMGRQALTLAKLAQLERGRTDVLPNRSRHARDIALGPIRARL